MADTTFVNGTTLTDEDWFNDVNRLHYTIFGDPATLAAANTKMNGTLGTEQASTSGTSIDFTSIPSGTKQITILFIGVSTNGTSNPLVQIGDAGGVETSGYLGACADPVNATGTNYTTGFGIRSAAAANVLHGTIVLTLENASAFTWACTGILALSNTANVLLMAGTKSLSAALDRVSITTVNGTDAFDAGAINIHYQ